MNKKTKQIEKQNHITLKQMTINNTKKKNMKDK